MFRKAVSLLPGGQGAVKTAFTRPCGGAAAETPGAACAQQHTVQHGGNGGAQRRGEAPETEMRVGLAFDTRRGVTSCTALSRPWRHAPEKTATPSIHTLHFIAVAEKWAQTRRETTGSGVKSQRTAAHHTISVWIPAVNGRGGGCRASAAASFRLQLHRGCVQGAAGAAGRLRPRMRLQGPERPTAQQLERRASSGNRPSGRMRAPVPAAQPGEPVHTAQTHTNAAEKLTESNGSAHHSGWKVGRVWVRRLDRRCEVDRLAGSG